MPLTLQNLDRLQRIVDELGIPTQYFIRFIQNRGGALTDLEAIIVELEAIIAAFSENEIIAGDVLSGGGKLIDGDVTLDHETSLVAPGVYGDATNVPQITVDEFGHVQLIENIPITGGGGGGSSRKLPVFVQLATVRNDATVALPVAPTVGNLMVWIATGWGGSINSYIPTGFSKTGQYNSNGDNAVLCAIREVEPGDTGSYAVSASDNQSGVLYEYSDTSYAAGLAGGYPTFSGSDFNFAAAPSPWQTTGECLLVMGHDTTPTVAFTGMTGLTQDYATAGGSGNHTGVFGRLEETATRFVAGASSGGGLVQPVFGQFCLIGDLA